MSQNAKLISYLQKYGSITTLEAVRELGILRISERVRECERLGWTIKHQRTEVPTREGKSAYVTKYILISEPEQQVAYG
jgi:hypothetical protein